MSRMKLVLQVTEDVQALADSLCELAEAMQSGEPEPTQGPKTEPEPQVEEVKQPTLEKYVACWHGNPKRGNRPKSKRSSRSLVLVV